MSNDYFQFKQFTVYQHHCAMKVGTDAVILGAYAPVSDAESVLDIGTGTGVVALMIAQRSTANITGIEIDTSASTQASENVLHSPWSDRISIIHADFVKYNFNEKYDCIVSNPPYFNNDLRSPNTQRNLARHTDSLSYEALLRGVHNILKEKGKFIVIIPTNAVNTFTQIAFIYNLHLLIKLTIYSLPNSISKRTILVLTNQKDVCCKDEQLIVESKPHQYTDAYFRLMQDYYLFL